MNVLVTGGTGALGPNAGRQIAAGKLLTPEHRDGKLTFEQHLEETYPA